MEYEEETPLEDVLARTFTIDLEIFGEKVTENLKKDGDKIYVTKENRQEFIDLYIDHLFIKQCEKQLKTSSEVNFVKCMYNKVGTIQSSRS